MNESKIEIPQISDALHPLLQQAIVMLSLRFLSSKPQSEQCFLFFFMG
jgi:hypothetical protein